MRAPHCSALGTVLSALLAVELAYTEDPISTHYGFRTSPSPRVMQDVAARHGWTIRDVDAALCERLSARASNEFGGWLATYL